MKILNTIFLAALITAGLACGYGSHSTTPTQAGIMPNITQLAPDNADAGSTNVKLTVNGTSFGGGAFINWNGGKLTTTVVNGTQLTANIPDANLATAGTAAVTVTNPGTQGGPYGGGIAAETSNSLMFTIN